MMLQVGHRAYAQYDVVKARTVENENIPIEDNNELKTFNDPDLPNFSQEESVS